MEDGMAAMAVDPAALALWQACLRAAQEERGRELLERFDRSLPFQDAVADRWERARALGFGEGASIYGSAFIYGAVRVGTGTWVGPNVILDGAGAPLEIGSWCSVSAGVHIYTHDTVAWALSGGVQQARHAPVRVGDRCYLGPQSIIAAGVTIGTCCVVAANSFVKTDVPERTVVGGSPARVLGRVEFDGDQPVLRFGGAS